MKRLIAVIVIILVSGFIAISVWKSTKNTSIPKIEESVGLSAKQKAKIRYFWQVYRKASDLRTKGKWEEAAAAYREALTINFRHKDALYYLGFPQKVKN